MALPISCAAAEFTELGVELKPWFAAKAIVLPWSNVAFVCATPGVRRAAHGWETYRGEPITASALRDGLRFYALDIVLRERKPVLQSAGFRTRSWLLLGLRLRPLYEDERRPHPSMGVITLESNSFWRAADLLHALETIDGHSRFDLLVSE
jgi:hypothetical protein